MNKKSDLISGVDEKLVDLQRVVADVRSASPDEFKRTKVFSEPSEVGIVDENPCVAGGVQIYNDRRVLLRYLAESRRSQIKTITEVGVLYGDLSAFIEGVFSPDLLHLIDRDFSRVRHKMNEATTKWYEGNSSEQIQTLRDKSIDLAYIDGDHTYSGARADIDAILPKMKDEAYIVFNDYNNINRSLLEPYGILTCVHELINMTTFRIHSMALASNGLHDICLCRGSGSTSLYGQRVGDDGEGR